jgi:hypothetical protein
MIGDPIHPTVILTYRCPLEPPVGSDNWDTIAGRLRHYPVVIYHYRFMA